MMRLVDLFCDDKDVFSILLSFLTYNDYQMVSSINHFSSQSSLRSHMFTHSTIRFPFPPLQHGHIQWQKYQSTTFLSHIPFKMLPYIISIALPHSECATIVSSTLINLKRIVNWSIPKQSIQVKGRKRNQWIQTIRCMDVNHFKKLSTLYQLQLTDCHLLHMKSIQSLQQLIRLDLSYTTFENPNDCKYIGILTQLQSLNLHGSSISCSHFLQFLIHLTWLNIESTKITSCMEIQMLKKLEYLNISDLWISSRDICFNELYQLRYFIANDVESYEPMEIQFNAPHLIKCDVHNSLLTNITSLKYSQELKTLDVRDTNLMDLDILKHCHQLKKLIITGEPRTIGSIPWSILTELEELKIVKWREKPHEYEAIDSSFIMSLHSLLYLQIHQLSDFSWVEFPRVQSLVIKTFTFDQDESYILDILDELRLESFSIRVQHGHPPIKTIISMASSLVELRLVDAITLDFSPLIQCQQLEILDLTVRETSTWRVLPSDVDFSFITGLYKTLRVLLLSGRHDFKHLSILDPCQKLEILYLDRTRITDVSLLTRFFHLRQLSLNGCTKITKSLPCWKSFTKLEFIGLPPNASCQELHCPGVFPALREIWHDDGYNCFWTGHDIEIE